MDARRAQDFLRHITQDNEFGVDMLTKATLSESIDIIKTLLPGCIEAAIDKKNENDEMFFTNVMQYYRPYVAAKIVQADRLWIAYSDHTGYPYAIDSDIFVAYDYAAVEMLQDRLDVAGYKVSFGQIDGEVLKTEIAHMYRNGYKNIRFTDGKGKPLVMAREEFYPYQEFFDDDYVTNPGLQLAMIEYFQELRKLAPTDSRTDMLKRREDRMFEIMVNSEFMVPCEKTETEDSVEIAHPYIDLTDRVTEKAEGEKVIAVPAFTDGFEMEKCYEGQRENMLYKFSDLVTLVGELDASGIIINAYGQSYYMNKKIMKIVAKR